MYVRIINGRPYTYESLRIGGKVVQTYLGPALPALVRLIKAGREEGAEIAEERRKLRRLEQVEERDREEEWRKRQEEVRAAMEAAGFHNPKGRGWRRKRSQPTTEIGKGQNHDL